jgi:hypothetical protein
VKEQDVNEKSMEHEKEVQRLAKRAHDAVKLLSECMERPDETRADRCRRKKTEYARRWYAANREKWNRYMRERYARKKAEKLAAKVGGVA